MVRGTDWVFFRVRVLVVLVVWSTQFPKLMLVGVRVCALAIRTRLDKKAGASNKLRQKALEDMGKDRM